MTSHFLFVGFSMRDANYKRIVGEVRSALGPHVGANASKLGKRKSDAHAVSSLGPQLEEEDDDVDNDIPLANFMATALTVDSWGNEKEEDDDEGDDA